MNANRYFEFEAAPTANGLTWEFLSHLRKRNGLEFPIRMSAAARVQRERVTIAMRIPWSERIPNLNEEINGV